MERASKIKYLWNNSKTGQVIKLLLILIPLLFSVMPISHAMIIEKGSNTNQSLAMRLTRSISASSLRPGGLNESVGINDNGSMLYNGQIINYFYGTNGLIGQFIFNGGSFYSGSPVDERAFSLQLNSNFNVTPYQTLWAQDVFGVTQLTNSTYNVSIWDNLWNSTQILNQATGELVPASLNSSLVSGEGSTYNYNGTIYYYASANQYYISQTPFTLIAYMNITQTSQGYPEINMYYIFENSTYYSGLIHYDTIIILEPSNNPLFLTGINPSISPYPASEYYEYASTPFVTQWVVGGAYSGAQLDVYSWNATMGLFYQFNESFYSIPDAVSLQPSIYSAFATEENVYQYYGISESYNNGLVNETAGRNTQEFLWEPSLNYTLNGGNLTLYPTPLYGRWLITINGTNYYNKLFGIYYPVSYPLPPGKYVINATLYAGSTPVLTIIKNITVGSIVNVSSPVSFYANGKSYSAGSYELSAPVSLNFPEFVMINSTYGETFEYLIVNNSIVNSNSITLSTSATVKAIYAPTYYVSVPFNAFGYVNETYQKITSGFYLKGTEITIPKQIVYVSQGVRYVIYKNTTFVVNSPLTISIPYFTQYYVNVNINVPANINGVNTTLESNYYNASTTIKIISPYYVNSTTREIISSNVTSITLNSPVSIHASIYYQYHVIIRLPNGTINNWYNISSVIELPTMIYNGSNERYSINQSNVIIVNSPVNITASYIKQFYVNIILPIGLINGWYNYSSVIKLPSMIYNGSNERYLLNQSNEVIVNKPINITSSYVKQYYVMIRLPNETINNWYNYSSVIKLPTMIYNGSSERYILNHSNQIVVNQAINLTPVYIKQYKVTIVLPNETLSNWSNNNQIINLPSVIYNGSEEKYVLLSQQSIVVNSSMNLQPPYQKMFLVTINGESSWYSYGERITLYEQVAPYDTVTWVGNYTLPNNSTITVSGPLTEKAEVSISTTTIGGVVAVVVVIAVALAVIRRK